MTTEVNSEITSTGRATAGTTAADGAIDPIARLDPWAMKLTDAKVAMELLIILSCSIVAAIISSMKSLFVVMSSAPAYIILQSWLHVP